MGQILLMNTFIFMITCIIPIAMYFMVQKVKWFYFRNFYLFIQSSRKVTISRFNLSLTLSIFSRMKENFLFLVSFLFKFKSSHSAFNIEHWKFLIQIWLILISWKTKEKKKILFIYLFYFCLSFYWNLVPFWISDELSWLDLTRVESSWCPYLLSLKKFLSSLNDA